MTKSIINSNAEFELGYWAIRGLAQPIRYLFAFSQVPLSEVRIGVDMHGEVLEDESSDWHQLRDTLPMPFPNLPYLIDRRGETPIYLAQSNAILRYLGREFELYGDCSTDARTIDMLQEEIYDYRNAVVKTAYTLGVEYEDAYQEFCGESVPRYLDRLDNYLSDRSKSHFVGNRTSFIDFVLYELLWQSRLMVPGSITNELRPNLDCFLRSFGELPEIMAYEKSADYIERPINSHRASFT